MKHRDFFDAFARRKASDGIDVSMIVYDCQWFSAELYYPMNDDKNNVLFEKYSKLADKQDNDC